MPKYIIEREMPAVHELTDDQLHEASKASNMVRGELGASDLQWVTSYISQDKIYCVYIAKDEDILREHARCLDIPADKISRVAAQTDPTTGFEGGSPAR